MARCAARRTLRAADRRRPTVAAAQPATTARAPRFLADQHAAFPFGRSARRCAARSSTRSRSRAARSSRCAASGSPTSWSRSRRRAGIAGARRRRSRSWTAVVGRVASFKGEIAEVRRKIDPSRRGGRQRQPGARQHPRPPAASTAKLRNTLDSFLRGRGHGQVPAGAGRHRSQRPLRADGAGRAPGCDPRHRARRLGQRRQPVSGAARDGRDQQRHRRAQEEEAEEVRRILLALTDAFRGRGCGPRRTIDVATELDVIQARARFSDRSMASSR